MIKFKSPEFKKALFENVYTIDFEKQLSHEVWDKDKTQEELMKEHGFLCIIKAEEKYNTYKDYDPVASALLEKRVIEADRGAIIYIVHDDAAAGLEAFLKCVEE